MNDRKEVVVASIAPYSQTTSQVAPLYASSPAAGFPAPGDDMVEKSLDLNELLIQNPTATFFVRVEGDSMEGGRIFSGDVLVVDRSVVAKDGKIVVAAVYGEMVVKRLSIKKGVMQLVSENQRYSPIDITNNDDCFIWGVVVGTVRPL